MKSLFPSLTYDIISFLNVHLAGLKYQPSAPPRANSWYRYFADLRNMSHTATISEKIQNIQNAGQRSTIEMITIFNTRNSSCFHASNSSRTWCNPPGIEKLLSPFPKMIFFGWAVAGSQPAKKKKTSTITMKTFAASLSFCRLVRPLILPPGLQGGLVG